MSLKEWIWGKAVAWLTRPMKGEILSPNDFECIMDSIRPADVLLVEGRTRVGEIIKILTRSSWSHSALCIGKLDDIKNPTTAALVRQHYDGDGSAPLLIEAELGRGTFVRPMTHYVNHHVRICRPTCLHYGDAGKVIASAAKHLGNEYDVHQLLDLARFVVPWWTIIPRRWHSSLFEHNAGIPTRTLCSTMLAHSFHKVDFPILPLIEEDREEGKLRLFKRNPRIFTPRDFDYSPYFSIIKCPLLRDGGTGFYHTLPWEDKSMHELSRPYMEDPDVLRIVRPSPADAQKTPATETAESGKTE